MAEDVTIFKERHPQFAGAKMYCLAGELVYKTLSQILKCEKNNLSG